MVSSRNYVVKGILEKAYEVEKEIIADLEQLGYDENDLFSVRLAMDEALINAIKHGNQGDPSKPLNIDYEADHNKVEISVEDQGEGFDHSSIADPTQDEHLNKTHGRGIFLIREFMTHVHFNEKGNRISFIYRRERKRSGEFMGLEWEQHDEVLLLKIPDSDVHTEPDQWEVAIEKFIAEGYKRIVADLSQHDYINTPIIAFLVMIAKRTRGVGGKCTVYVARERVRRILEATNLHQLFEIHEDLQSAMDGV